MHIEQDVGIEVNDGCVLRANVFRPREMGTYPVVLVHGVYGKDVHFRDAFPEQWSNLHRIYPGLSTEGSSGRYLRWETVDPDRWVPDGFAVVHVDARGAGRSPGFLDPMSPREIQDYCDVIEWAATQVWSNGKVGTIGISYYALTQWRVAALRPRGHAAMIVWEGASDTYREMFRHGGILSNTFWQWWWPRHVLSKQHGNAGCPYADATSGHGRANGEVRLSAEQLRSNRCELVEEIAWRELDGAWYAQRSPALERIEIPLLSAGNWGGAGLHLRGNVEGFERAGSRQKWLSLHIGTHYESFYLPQYIHVQKQFFGRFLRGDPNGWDRRPRVCMVVRHPCEERRRECGTFPPEGTLPMEFYLDEQLLSPMPPTAEARIEFDAGKRGSVRLRTAPMEQETEFCGFAKLILMISSTTDDTDLFVALHVHAPDGSEVVFTGAHDRAPLSRGWLRASHRETDAARGTPLRVFHPHQKTQPLVPDVPCEVELEIWPLSIVLPKGYSFGLTVSGSDIPVEGALPRHAHDDPRDRGHARFQGRTTIHTGPASRSRLAMPHLPSKEKQS